MFDRRYRANLARCRRLAASTIRFTVFTPRGGRLALKLSPLDAVKDVKREVGRAAAAGCKVVGRCPQNFVVLRDGSPLADESSLEDAGVANASSLVVARMAPGTSDEIPPQAHLVATGEKRRDCMRRRASALALAVTAGLRNPKEERPDTPPEVHRLYRGANARARLGRQFPAR